MLRTASAHPSATARKQAPTITSEDSYHQNSRQLKNLEKENFSTQLQKFLPSKIFRPKIQRLQCPSGKKQKGNKETWPYSCAGYLENTRAWMTDTTPVASSVCALSRSCLAGLSNQNLSGPLTLLVTIGPATLAAWGQGHSIGPLWGRDCLCRTQLGTMAGLSATKVKMTKNVNLLNWKLQYTTVFTSCLRSLPPLKFHSSGTTWLTTFSSSNSPAVVPLFLGPQSIK